MIDKKVLDNAYITLNKILDERVKERSLPNGDKLYFSSRYYVLTTVFHGLKGFIESYENGSIESSHMEKYSKVLLEYFDITLE